MHGTVVARVRPAVTLATVALGYLVWTSVMMWPVLRHPVSTIPMDSGDPVLNAAIMQWNATSVPLSAAWWSFPLSRRIGCCTG